MQPFLRLFLLMAGATVLCFQQACGFQLLTSALRSNAIVRETYGDRSSKDRVRDRERVRVRVRVRESMTHRLSMSNPTNKLPSQLEALFPDQTYHDEWQSQYRFKESKDGSALLRSLADNPIIEGKEGMKSIQMSPFGYLTPTTYIIRKCYENMLKSMWTETHNVLLGHPGLGKTMFLVFLLLYFLKPGMIEGGIEKLKDVEYIVYCIPNESVVIFHPESRIAFKSSTSNFDFGDVDPKKCMYVWEPGSDRSTYPKYLRNILSLILVSPLPERIQEFLKQFGTARIFMPLFRLQEALQAKNIQALAIPDEVITTRFRQVNGIYRALTMTPPQFDVYLQKLQQAVSKCSFDLFKQGETSMIIDDPKDNYEHFVLQYEVNETDFRTYKPRISTDYVLSLMKNESHLDEVAQLREIVLNNCASEGHGPK